MNLVIVESPGKTKKIQSILGNAYRVMASVGHVRDLPLKEIGVQAPDFKPGYCPTERGREVLKKLQSAVKSADSVYLATDPDREGEAIAWHLQDSLHLHNPARVTFQEITEKAVKAAFQNPGKIDMNLVRAQEGRRVLDRLVGYMVSGELSRNVAEGKLSAGRVQSPALKLVVEREKAIRDFKIVAHFGASLTFEFAKSVSDGWSAEWNPTLGGWLEEGREFILDRDLAEKIAAIRVVTVCDFENKVSKEAPPAPFTTSALQQAASGKLKLSPKKTMELAQKLYEGGHISYMRTDSPNLSAEAIAGIRSWACANNLDVPHEPRIWKSKGNAQEAHEAIRPTHIEIEATGADESEQALYSLIRATALASQLEDAVYEINRATLQSALEGKEVFFIAQGRKLIKPGWRKILSGYEGNEGNEPAKPIPVLETGNKLSAASGKLLSKKTKPPARYSEAGLIRELEKIGIGRPSTYASILDNITGRGYVSIEKRQLKPSAVGEKIIAAMDGRFSFLDYNFTNTLECCLDDIAEGKTTYLDIVRDFHHQLKKELDEFVAANSFACPQCGKALRRFQRSASEGKKGFNFFGCSAYPDCKATYPVKDERPDFSLKKEKTV
ncbi:MAG: type I DNA topoisomerase [Desulfarculales bacterium]|jgi:DNA topoisomerase-1|nr:type I DNA topoisomerase [Desulfarculales bacterium]